MAQRELYERFRSGLERFSRARNRRFGPWHHTAPATAAIIQTVTKRLRGARCVGARERSVTKRGSDGKAAGEDLCDAQVFVEKDDVRIGVGVEYPFFVLDSEEGGRIQGQHAQGVGE